MGPQKKSFFFCTAIIAMLCTTAFAASAETKTVSRTVGSILKDTEKVFILIVPAGEQVAKSGVNLRKLEAAVRNNLKRAGIAAVIRRTTRDTARSMGIADLRIDIDMFEFDIVGQYVFSVQTSLAIKVSLLKKSSKVFKADVWSTGSTLSAASEQNVSEAVTQTVVEQVRMFIAHVKPKIKSGGSHIIDSNDVPAKKSKAKSQPKQTEEVKIKYFSSAGSKKFHKQSCRYVKRIHPENIAEYDTRKQAIEIGKKPCKSCKP